MNESVNIGLSKHLRNEGVLFYAFFLSLVLISFLLLYMGIVSPACFGWAIFASVIVSTFFSHRFCRTAGAFRKIKRSVVIKVVDRGLLLVLALTIVQATTFTIYVNVREFPLVFSYGNNSSMVGGQIGGPSNLSFVAQSFPINASLTEVEEVILISNRGDDPHSFTFHLIEGNQTELSRIKSFKIFVLTNDEREFTLYDITNGTVNLDNSIGIMIPPHKTWSVGISSQMGGAPISDTIRIRLGIRLWLESYYAEGMNIEIKLIP